MVLALALPQDAQAVGADGRDHHGGGGVRDRPRTLFDILGLVFGEDYVVPCTTGLSQRSSQSSSFCADERSCAFSTDGGRPALSRLNMSLAIAAAL